MSLNFHFYLSCMLLVLFGCNCSAAKQPNKGLSMEVISLKSQESPLNDLISTNPHANIDEITPITSYWYPFLFLVKVGIGRFAENPGYKSYYFQVDTGSNITWIQCQGCQSKGNTCSPQRDPYYPNSQSISYKPIPCNQHSFCQKNQCNSGSCAFNRTFSPVSYTTGILANETLTFPASNGELQALAITIGCSTDSKNLKYPLINRTELTPVSGALGLGWGPRSFLAQIDDISDGKFSYCVKQSNTTTSFLRFGQDIVLPPNPKTTSIAQVSTLSDYYVNVTGLSVNGVKINVSESEFSVKGDGTGGVVLDAGTLFTLMVTPIYSKVLGGLEDVLSKNKFLKKEQFHNFTDLCYEELSPEGRKDLPSLTFHLQNADLEIEPESLFLFANFKGRKVFCLAILGNEFRNSIGSYHQLNQKFVFDTKAKTVTFGRVDCEKDS